MATRGTIALEFTDGTVGMVYSHWDNHPSWNGKILQEHYLDPFKVRQLIDLGSVSSLRAEIGVQHPFDNPHRLSTDEYRAHESLYGTMTTFYGRDRDDQGEGANYFQDFADYEANGDWQEYNYILRQGFDGQPVWYVNGQTLASALSDGMEDDE